MDLKLTVLAHFFVASLVMEKIKNRETNYLNHIMFLPVFGSLDHDFVFNAAVVVIFLIIYAWHLKHDHKHNEEILSEVKKIRENLEAKK